MPHFVFCPHRLDPCRPRNLPINKSKDLHLIRTLRLLLQVLPFLLWIEAAFVGIGQQIIRLGMRGMTNLLGDVPVRRVAISRPRFFSVPQGDSLVKLHLAFS
jgi:hypothetical protein